MAKRILNVEEPGSPAAEPVAEAPADAPVEAAPAVDDSDPATLLQDLELAPPAGTVSPPLIGASTAHLPDAAEVDPSQIKTMTLTKQGWVLPVSMTSQAAG